MSEIVEREAQALFERRYGSYMPRDGRSPLDWKACVADARVAIGAIREPSDVMINAGMNVGDIPACHGEVEAHYIAMIDAALK